MSRISERPERDDCIVVGHKTATPVGEVCEYCRSGIDITEKRCDSCGAPNKHYRIILPQKPKLHPHQEECMVYLISQIRNGKINYTMNMTRSTGPN